MSRNRSILTILFIVIIVLMPLSYSYAGNIKIGILANKGIDDALKRWTLTAEYLQNKIATHSFSIIPLTFAQVEPAVMHGDIDFLITNPAMYAEMEALHGASRIMTMIDNGLTQFGGVLFCKSDRQDIQTIDDLKGKSFIAVEKNSLGGWLMAWGELKHHGIDPFRDFAPMLFAGDHLSVIKAVRDGKVDAGTVRTDSLERLAKDGSIDLSDFRVIHEKHYNGFPYRVSTALYPEWPLAKLMHTSDELTKTVALELLSLPPDSPANKAAGIGGWTIPLNYQIVHDLLKELRFGPYKEYGLITWQQILRQYWHWFLSVLIVLLLMGSGLMVIYGINRKLVSANLQRDLAEVELKRTNQEKEMILNSIGEGLFGMDLRGMITFINPTGSNLLGYHADEVLGRNLHDLIHYKKPDGTPYPWEECPMNFTIKTGEISQEADEVFWKKTGEPLPVEYMTSAIEEGGKIVGTVGVFRDITWRKQAEIELKQSNEYLEKIFDSSNEGIGIVDSDGLVRKWNKAAEETYGYTFKELQGRPASDLYADKDELANMLIQLRRDDYVKNYEIEMRKKDGNTLACSLSIKMLHDEKGRTIGSVTVARDLTELKQKEAKLQTANEQLIALVQEANQRNHNLSLLQEISDVFQSCQTSGETYSTIAHFMPKFFPDFGGALYIQNNSKDIYEMKAPWGEATTLELVFDPDDCWSLRRTRAHLVADSGSAMNCRHVSTEVSGSYLCLPLVAQGEIMGILHLRKTTPEQPDRMKSIGLFAITIAEAVAMALANMKLRETLHDQAIRDGLTGLFNRRYLEETLERELSRGKRSGTSVGAIMLDLDYFKEYNDTFGHVAGDELLCALGQLIQGQIRKEDIACRYGGEEFLLLMPGASMEIALKRANELNLSVKQLPLQNKSQKQITISAGVAIFPEHGSIGQDIIKAADAAMYRAKEEGRDRVCISKMS